MGGPNSYYQKTQVAEEYEKLRFGDETGRYMHQKELSLILKELPPLEGLEILDVGAGTGRLSRELVARGAFVVAVDSSRSMLAAAKSKAKSSTKTPLKIEAVLCDIHFLPFKDLTFDAALSAYVINHVVDYTKVLDEIQRIAKAHIMIIVPYFLSVLAPLPCFINPLRKLVRRLHVFSRYFMPNEIEGEFRNRGLSVRQVGLYLVPPKVLSFSLIPPPLTRLIEKLHPFTEPILRDFFAVQATIASPLQKHT